MICPKCKATIEDDSFYCDQCGNEINLCPKCGNPGRGKVCTEDGTKLLPARMRKQGTAPRVEHSTLESPSVAPVKVLAAQHEPTLPAPLRLLNKSLQADLTPHNGDILGRKEGPFSVFFAPHQQVSGRHAKLSYDQALGWSITDLGSTNGTTYKGKKLVANVPQLLADQSFLLIANIEFYVQIEMQPDPTKTVLAE